MTVVIDTNVYISALHFSQRRGIPAQAVSLCRDPDDDKFLECAERAGADLIVTGDRDLLAIGSHGRTRIVTPAEYLTLD